MLVLIRFQESYHPPRFHYHREPSTRLVWIFCVDSEDLGAAEFVLGFDGK